MLFGSGAEDRLRPSSDLNVAVVLRRFVPERAELHHDALRAAGAAARLRVLLLTDEELPAFLTFFPVKAADIGRRHRVLWGEDPFGRVQVPRAAAIFRLQQSLLNLALRLRVRLVEEAGDAEALARALAEAAGPLRVSAAELLELSGAPVPDPKAALEQVAGRALPALTAARAGEALSVEGATTAARELLALAEEMRGRAARLEQA